MAEQKIPISPTIATEYANIQEIQAVGIIQQVAACINAAMAKIPNATISRLNQECRNPMTARNAN